MACKEEVTGEVASSLHAMKEGAVLPRVAENHLVSEGRSGYRSPGVCGTFTTRDLYH